MFRKLVKETGEGVTHTLMAWYRNTACIDSRMTSLPRKEKERLLTPPLIRQPGHAALILGMHWINASPYLNRHARVSGHGPRARQLCVAQMRGIAGCREVGGVD